MASCSKKGKGMMTYFDRFSVIRLGCIPTGIATQLIHSAVFAPYEYDYDTWVLAELLHCSDEGFVVFSPSDCHKWTVDAFCIA